MKPFYAKQEMNGAFEWMGGETDSGQREEVSTREGSGLSLRGNDVSRNEKSDCTSEEGGRKGSVGSWAAHDSTFVHALEDSNRRTLKKEGKEGDFFRETRYGGP